MKPKIEKIAIVGAGLIGSGWAAFYASKGFAVSLHEAEESLAQAGLERTLGFLRSLCDLGLLTSEEHTRAAALVTIASDLAEAVAGARLIQESLPERYDIKKDIFQQIDRFVSPEAVVASSSSGLLISELQTVMEHPERSLIAHPFNPPYLIPLVELVPGKLTSPAILDETKSWFESLGKVPVVLNKEVPGHIANRLQAAVWREAISLVLSGVASVADVDKAMSAGPGLRWALFGPHMIFHIGGGAGGMQHFTDHVGVTMEQMWKDMASWTSLPPETAAALVSGLQAEAGHRSLSELAMWRDEKLVLLLRALYGD